MAKRRACSCSFSRSGVCHGGSSRGGSGCQVSFDVTVGLLGQAMITYTLVAGHARRTPWSSAQVSNATPRVVAVSVPGVDVPDSRGRTGLDRVGRDLTGNPD